MILTSGVFAEFSAEYSVVVFPDPVGPVTRQIPLGCSTVFFKEREFLFAHAEALEIERDHAAVEHAHTNRFAEIGGERRDAEIDRITADSEFDTVILWHAAFGDVHVRHDLDAAAERQCQAARRRWNFKQRAVDAVADFEIVFERLEVDVGGLIFDRGQQHEIQEFDDGAAFTMASMFLASKLFALFSSTCISSPDMLLSSSLIDSRWLP